MGFSDTFAVIGVVLALAAVALLFARKVQAGGTGAGAALSRRGGKLAESIADTFVR